MRERIIEIRRDARLSQEEFGNRLDITANYVWMIEKGQRVPSERLMKSICREFGVNETWLRTGEGEPYTPKDRETRLTDAVNRLLSGENPEFKRRLILVLSALDESQWAFLEEKLLEIVGGRESVAPPPKRDAYGWTDEEYHAELDRQLAKEKEAAEKSSDSGRGSSVTDTG